MNMNRSWIVNIVDYNCIDCIYCCKLQQWIAKCSIWYWIAYIASVINIRMQFVLLLYSSLWKIYRYELKITCKKNPRKNRTTENFLKLFEGFYRKKKQDFWRRSIFLEIGIEMYSHSRRGVGVGEGFIY